MVRFDGPADLSGSLGLGGATTSTTAPATGGRRRRGRGRRKRRRRRGRSTGSIDELPSGTGIAQPDGSTTATGVATDDNVCSAGAAQAPPGSTMGAPTLCLPEHDPLAEAMCTGDGPPALVVSFDPMLEELLAAAFIVSCYVEAAPRGLWTRLGGGCPLASAVGADANAAHTSTGGASRRRGGQRGRPLEFRGAASGGGYPLASAVGAGVGAAHASSGGLARRRDW